MATNSFLYWNTHPAPFSGLKVKCEDMYIYRSHSQLYYMNIEVTFLYMFISFRNDTAKSLTMKHV
jgi:hypothetical protein